MLLLYFSSICWIVDVSRWDMSSHSLCWAVLIGLSRSSYGAWRTKLFKSNASAEGRSFLWGNPKVVLDRGENAMTGENLCNPKRPLGRTSCHGNWMMIFAGKMTGWGIGRATSCFAFFFLCAHHFFCRVNSSSSKDAKAKREHEEWERDQPNTHYTEWRQRV